MSRSRGSDDEDPGARASNRMPGWLAGLLTAEALALAIALVTPITPSKTGSTWSPAHFFKEDPSYLEKVAASFVMVNVLLLLLGLVVVAVSRLDRPR